MIEPKHDDMDSNKLTHFVPERRHNHLDYCFMCPDTEGPRKMDTVLRAVKNDINVESEKEKEDDEVEGRTKCGKYIRCSFPKCNQWMHEKCADDFICGEYSPKQAQLLFNLNGPVCTAHFCWHCYDERHKNASRFDELIDCIWCMRSFHEQCIPAGTKLLPNYGKKKAFVCHIHCIFTPSITSEMRLKHCSDCELDFQEDQVGGSKKGKRIDKGEEKIECRKCANVFHRKCAFQRVVGIGCDIYKNDLCSYCVTGLTIVPNQHVIAYCETSRKRYPKGYYPATAISCKDVPSDVNLGRNFGMTGYICVRWMWGSSKKPFFHLVHKSQVHRITTNCHKSFADSDFKNELKKLKIKYTAPTHPLNHVEMMKTVTIVTENVFVKGITKQSIRERVEIRDCFCVADKVTGIKCDTSRCFNRQSHSECPKSCGENCQNRALQQKREIKCEVREAADGKGYGLFAIRDIEPEEFIGEYCGEVIDLVEWKRRERRQTGIRSEDEFTYFMGLTDKYKVDARFIGSIARYANHSCEPNSEVEGIDVPVSIHSGEEATYEPHLGIFAKEKIKAGAEITFDYMLKKSQGLAVDFCYCRAEKCKMKIGEKSRNDDSDDEKFDENLYVSDDEEDEERKDEKENKKKDSKKLKKEKNGKMVHKRQSSMGGSNDKIKKKK
ncbi:hypothetical protein PRIPAC_74473 [Pristionchus pacificus]|uniref:SET domain-containing protein n=1 Tax=Pristionchus pacificus TaxID=54126 RepID=A0A2A6D0G0_PRIPA|nr:hypothetical protein PRIPAC_74473 [Pristionchus pacificus]|eukprot:PDM83763.1 SET domain-containing protein [Pristionchus pacificus]